MPPPAESVLVSLTALLYAASHGALGWGGGSSGGDAGGAAAAAPAGPQQQQQEGGQPQLCGGLWQCAWEQAAVVCALCAVDAAASGPTSGRSVGAASALAVPLLLLAHVGSEMSTSVAEEELVVWSVRLASSLAVCAIFCGDTQHWTGFASVAHLPLLMVFPALEMMSWQASTFCSITTLLFALFFHGTRRTNESFSFVERLLFCLTLALSAAHLVAIVPFSQEVPRDASDARSPHRFASNISLTCLPILRILQSGLIGATLLPFAAGLRKPQRSGKNTPTAAASSSSTGGATVGAGNGGSTSGGGSGAAGAAVVAAVAGSAGSSSSGVVLLRIGMWLFVVVYPTMFAAVQHEPLLWVGKLLVLANSQCLFIALRWVVILVLAVPAIQYISTRLRLRTIVARKLFHFLAVFMFLPVTYRRLDMMTLSYGVALGALIFLEVLRYHRIQPLGSIVQAFYSQFLDDRDSPDAFITTHIYLLLGCAIPTVIHQAMVCHPGSSLWYGNPYAALLPHVGYVSIGIGDAVAAMIGSRYGRHCWPFIHRTVEGSLAMALSLFGSMVLVTYWQDPDLLDSFVLSRLGMWAVAVTALEAYTRGVDNLTLPMFSALCFFVFFAKPPLAVRFE